MPICVCLTGPSQQAIVQQAADSASIADLWEVRCDLLDDQAWNRLPDWLPSLRDRPIILTLRSVGHGGGYEPKDPIRRAALAALQALTPDWLDLEWPNDVAWIEDLQRISPHTKLIISWHGQQMPQDLESSLQSGDFDAQVNIWKIAPQCPDAASWVQWERWWQENSVCHKTILFQPQGPLGLVQRIWSDHGRQPWTYIAAEHPKEGQISSHEWVQVYRMQRPPESDEYGLYGVVGDPVAQSRGRLIHNFWMQKIGWRGRYAPLRCAAKDWPLFWPWLKENALGLAVTTPLKQIVTPYLEELDEIAQLTGAVNTLIRQGERWIGKNTDGMGAIAAMGGESLLYGKRVLVIGAGGVGPAIAAACAQSGAYVTMIARRPEAVSSKIASLVDVRSIKEWPQLAPNQDWIVQATTCGFHNDEVPVDPNLLQGQQVLEVVQRETPFATIARTRNCTVISGVDMFVHLSIVQANFWSKGASDCAFSQTLTAVEMETCLL